MDTSAFLNSCIIADIFKINIYVFIYNFIVISDAWLFI